MPLYNAVAIFRHFSDLTARFWAQTYHPEQPTKPAGQTAKSPAKRHFSAAIRAIGRTSQSRGSTGVREAESSMVAGYLACAHRIRLGIRQTTLLRGQSPARDRGSASCRASLREAGRGGNQSYLRPSPQGPAGDSSRDYCVHNSFTRTLERPWIVLRQEHRTITLDEGVSFYRWARDTWPEARYSVQLDPWQLSQGSPEGLPN